MSQNEREAKTEPVAGGLMLAEENRRASRMTEACYLTYSGISEGRVIVGEGSSVDLSPEGFGVEGSRTVIPGALLTLCFCLPDGHEPLVVEEVRVAWVRGNRFGVQSVAIGHDERKRLARYVNKYQGRAKRKTTSGLDFSLPLEALAS
ncbi:hypothetical protein YTPLAS18_38930 [Nitrospira sp.]|nr:hypothetical protein YTPLAS18_38930 [Nitrospira sp.]